MLSLQFIRENSDRVRRDVLLRNTEAPIDRILELDEERRRLLQDVESRRAQRNASSKAIGAGAAPDREARIAAMREVSRHIDTLDARLKVVEEELQQKLYEVPNTVDPTVPKGPDEHSNVVLETVGAPSPLGFEARPHWELGERLGGIDLAAGVRMSGARFFVLQGGVARLHRALIQWMLDIHTREGGFEERYLPVMVSEASLFASGHLPKFRENLYHDAEQDYYLIPTAEAPFVNLYRDQILRPGLLPQRLVAHTPCFRREKVSAGRDVRGIKRVHQFEKVEMFTYCEPDQSPAELDLLLRRARLLAERLEIPHRVVQLCSGDLDFKATKSFDLELWSPGVAEWLEVSSVSNCLDFQARRANIRYRPAPEAPTRHPHTLNASGLGLPRTLIAVLENYQQEDGSVAIPSPLKPYLGEDPLRPPSGP